MRPTTPCPRLAEGDVHVWRVTLAGRDPDSEAALLDVRERARAHRLRLDASRRQFVLARAALRRLVGLYLGKAPAELELTQGPFGKPMLRWPRPPLRFNVSHSGDLAVVAFAEGADVGVDVEQHRSDLDVDSLARVVCSPAELARISSLATAGARQSAFFELWTRKEAVLKALGRGLRLPLESVELPAANPCTCEVRVGPRGDDRFLIEVRALEIGAGFSAAVAHHGPVCRLVLYSDPGPRLTFTTPPDRARVEAAGDTDGSCSTPSVDGMNSGQVIADLEVSYGKHSGVDAGSSRKGHPVERVKAVT